MLSSSICTSLGKLCLQAIALRCVTLRDGKSPVLILDYWSRGYGFDAVNHEQKLVVGAKFKPSFIAWNV